MDKESFLLVALCYGPLLYFGVNIFYTNPFVAAIGVTFVLISAVVLLGSLSWGSVSSEGKAVFITGCDTGFGYGLAKRLDNLGFQVFAGCYLPEEPGAKTLRQESSERLHIVPIDVTSEQQIQDALKYVQENLGDKELHAVVNNAGIGEYCEFEWFPMEMFEKLYQVNTLGTVRVTRAFLPLMRRSRGRIINIASLAGRYALPGFISYSMSKHAVIAFSDGMRREMKKFGIKVILVEPTLYRTPISSPQRLLESMKKYWSDTPQDIKDAYGEEYFKESLRKTEEMLTLRPKDNIQEVIDDMVDAVVSVQPKVRYVPSLITKIRSRILTSLPTSVMDAIFNGMMPDGKLAADSV